MRLDNYRWGEVPRIVDHDGKTYRILQGFRGSFAGLWDWDSAVLYSKAQRDEVTRNRVSNTLMTEALYDPTPAAYNPWADDNPENTNIERALIDVYRNNETDLKLIDFKVSNPALFSIWGGREIGFLAGAEYREESFDDDRDPRLDGTIVFTDAQGDTFPFVSDVVNSSPTPDNSGSRDVLSLFTEFILPLHDTFDLQLALRYEDFSDFGDTTNFKIASRYSVTDALNIRGAVSTGFHAPTAGQASITNVTTQNVNGQLVDQGTLPLSSAAGQLAAGDQFPGNVATRGFLDTLECFRQRV